MSESNETARAHAILHYDGSECRDGHRPVCARLTDHLAILNAERDDARRELAEMTRLLDIHRAEGKVSTELLQLTAAERDVLRAAVTALRDDKVHGSFSALLMGDAEEADWPSLRYQAERNATRAERDAAVARAEAAEKQAAQDDTNAKGSLAWGKEQTALLDKAEQEVGRLRAALAETEKRHREDAVYAMGMDLGSFIKATRAGAFREAEKLARSYDGGGPDRKAHDIAEDIMALIPGPAGKRLEAAAAASPGTREPVAARSAAPTEPSPAQPQGSRK